ANTLRRMNRDVGAGRVRVLFVRAAIDGVIDKIGANAAVIEQRVALPGRSVSGHRLALAARVDQERQNGTLGLLHLFVEGPVDVGTRDAPLLFAALEIDDAGVAGTSTRVM